MKPVEVSLRTLAPHRWDSRFSCLYYYTVVLRYGVPNNPNDVTREFLIYIRELCSAMLRLMKTAILSYEDMTDARSSNKQAPFMFLSAGCSCLDAMAAIIGAALTKKIPSPKRIPGMARIEEYLKKENKPLLAAEFKKLLLQPWCDLLFETRHKMIHRGYWFSRRAYPQKTSGVYLTRTPGLLEGSGYRTLAHGQSHSEWEETDFQSIASGLFLKLEQWQIHIHDALSQEEEYDPSLDCLMHFIPMGENDRHESIGYLTKEQSREILNPVII